MYRHSPASLDTIHWLYFASDDVACLAALPKLDPTSVSCIRAGRTLSLRGGWLMMMQPIRTVVQSTDVRAYNSQASGARN